jgi:hypothetical protein
MNEKGNILHHVSYRAGIAYGAGNKTAISLGLDFQFEQSA